MFSCEAEPVFILSATRFIPNDTHFNHWLLGTMTITTRSSSVTVFKFAVVVIIELKVWCSKSIVKENTHTSTI